MVHGEAPDPLEKPLGSGYREVARIQKTIHEGWFANTVFKDMRAGFNRITSIPLNATEHQIAWMGFSGHTYQPESL